MNGRLISEEIVVDVKNLWIDLNFCKWWVKVLIEGGWVFMWMFIILLNSLEEIRMFDFFFVILMK